ncbi:unnamed protein product [Chrysoparadoxa australica]
MTPGMSRPVVNIPGAPLAPGLCAASLSLMSLGTSMHLTVLQPRTAPIHGSSALTPRRPVAHVGHSAPSGQQPMGRAPRDEKEGWEGLPGYNGRCLVAGGWGQGAEQYLPEWPRLSMLETLVLRGNALSTLAGIGLEACVHLVHLDLSHNALSALTLDSSAQETLVHLEGQGGRSHASWGHLTSLRVLLLHDNNIEDWRQPALLGETARLSYLTLYGNPLAERASYREFVANTCTALLGLDSHVLSDEELVEGASLGPRYGSCTPNFQLPVQLLDVLKDPVMPRFASSPLSPAYSDMHKATESACLSKILRRLDILRRLHASNSPVILMQNAIRSWVQYRKHSSAAVQIQKQARVWVLHLKLKRELRALMVAAGRIDLIEQTLSKPQTWALRMVQARYRFLRKLRRTKQRICLIEVWWKGVLRRWAAYEAALEKGGSLTRTIAVGAGHGELLRRCVRASLRAHLGEEAGEFSELEGTQELRPATYAQVKGWPVLTGEMRTDGLFCTTSGLLPSPQISALSLTRQEDMQRSCLKRRGARYGVPLAASSGTCRQSSCSEDLNLLVVYTAPTWSNLARVLWRVRQEKLQRPVPILFTDHVRRSAAALVIQSHWRGFVVRWDLRSTFPACLLMWRGAILLQRWWRLQRGIWRRLQLLRKLKTQLVHERELLIEMEVYYMVTQPSTAWGTTYSCRESRVAFGFQDGRVALGRGRELPRWLTGQTRSLKEGSSPGAVASLLTEGVTCRGVLEHSPGVQMMRLEFAGGAKEARLRALLLAVLTLDGSLSCVKFARLFSPAALSEKNKAPLPSAWCQEVRKLLGAHDAVRMELIKHACMEDYQGFAADLVKRHSNHKDQLSVATNNTMAGPEGGASQASAPLKDDDVPAALECHAVRPGLISEAPCMERTHQQAASHGRRSVGHSRGGAEAIRWESSLGQKLASPCKGSSHPSYVREVAKLQAVVERKAMMAEARRSMAGRLETIQKLKEWQREEADEVERLETGRRAQELEEREQEMAELKRELHQKKKVQEAALRETVRHARELVMMKRERARTERKECQGKQMMREACGKMELEKGRDAVQVETALRVQAAKEQRSLDRAKEAKMRKDRASSMQFASCASQLLRYLRYHASGSRVKGQHNLARITVDLRKRAREGARREAFAALEVEHRKRQLSATKQRKMLKAQHKAKEEQLKGQLQRRIDCMQGPEAFMPSKPAGHGRTLHKAEIDMRMQGGCLDRVAKTARFPPKAPRKTSRKEGACNQGSKEAERKGITTAPRSPWPHGRNDFGF